MRGVVAVTAVLFASVLSSGCFVEQDDPDTQATAGDATPGSGSSSATGAGKAPGSAIGTGAGAAAGSPPVLGNVSVNATGLEAAFSLVATDADNDTLTWSIAFGDNATANGTFQAGAANATHAYAAAGTYNATVTVSDGHSAANRTVAVTVSDAVAGEPMAPLELSGSCTTEVEETVDHVFTVTPGQALIHATIAVGGGGVDLDWSLIDPSGGEADVAESFTPRGEGALDAEAPAAGDWTIRVTCFVGVAASYDIDVTFA